MDDVQSVIDRSVETLRHHGARFAYLHGSRATGKARADSDVDIATYFGGSAPPAYDVLLPPKVDLMILDDAPLELAGRVALEGTLIFDDDPVARVHWEATTRKIYADELPRIRRSRREFLESVRRG